MPTESSREDLEDQFTAAFQALLNRAVAHVSEGAGSLLVPALVDEALFRSFLQMAEWPEAKHSLDLALRTPTLRPLTWDAAGTPIQDPRYWVNLTVFPAVKRYCAFAAPSAGAARFHGHARRIARVTSEVITWAKLDPVPVVTTTLVHGLRTDGRRRRFKLTKDTVLRISTTEEWEPLVRGGELVQQPLCIETKEELPRLQSPPRAIPHLFIQALQLILNSPVMLGNTVAQATVPTFGVSNLEGQLVRRHPELPLLSAQLVTSREVGKARRVAVAFEDLVEAGFDLALDLYVTSLRKANRRERAVDIAIALENLYLGKERDELRYRFQLHIIAFGRRLKPAERIDIRTAKKLYDARSSVVHGSRPRTEDIRLLDSVGASLVRATLLRIVSQRDRRLLQSIQDEIEGLVGHKDR